MSDNKSFVSPAYLKLGCPFSFKFLVFMAEAKLLDHIDIVEMAADSDDFEAIKDQLTAKLGKPATFPTVEIEPGVFNSESDELIAHFANRFSIDVGSLEVLPFYKNGMMSNLRAMFMQNKAYREKFGELTDG